MLRAIKIRLYPDETQANFIVRQMGCCRLVYNKGLDYRSTMYKDSSVSVSSTELQHYVVELKDEYAFLKEVHSKVLQQTIRDLTTAFDNFFKHKSGYPKFKCKHDNRHSCRFPIDAIMGIRGNRMDFVKSFKDVLFKCSRKDEIYLNSHQDQIKSVTVTKQPSGIFTASVLIDGDLRSRNSVKDTNNCIGIDLGVKDFVITSEGEVFDNKHFTKNHSNRLKRLQRQLSRKEKGSKNRNKIRIKLAREYEKITNKKTDYLHHVSNSLIDENQVICMEDLNVKGMTRNHSLAASICEINLGEFRRILEYKAKWYNRQLVFVDRFYPSSKTCHVCGYKYKTLKLSEREWVCPECGTVHDRDRNAAMNILSEGLSIIGLSSPESKPVDHPTVDDIGASAVLKSSGGMKQKNMGNLRVSINFYTFLNYDK